MRKRKITPIHKLPVGKSDNVIEREPMDLAGYEISEAPPPPAEIDLEAFSAFADALGQSSSVFSLLGEAFGRSVRPSPLRVFAEQRVLRGERVDFVMPSITLE